MSIFIHVQKKASYLWIMWQILFCKEKPESLSSDTFWWKASCLWNMLEKIFNKSYLNFYLQTHTDEIHHVPEICRKAFSKKVDLSRHIYTYAGEKPKVCDTCNKGFPKKCKLNNDLDTYMRKTDYLKSCHLLNAGEKKLIFVKYVTQNFLNSATWLSITGSIEVKSFMYVQYQIKDFQKQMDLSKHFYASIKSFASVKYAAKHFYNRTI